MKLSPEVRSRLKPAFVGVNIDDLLETLLEFMLTFVKASNDLENLSKFK